MKDLYFPQKVRAEQQGSLSAKSPIETQKIIIAVTKRLGRLRQRVHLHRSGYGGPKTGLCRYPCFLLPLEAFASAVVERG